MRLTTYFHTPSARRLFSALFMWFFMVPLTGNAAGIIWSPATGLPQKALTATFNSVRFINGQFFAIGNSGIIISSSDGNTWNDRNTVTTDLFQDIGWKSGSGYVVVGDNALSLSDDGNPPWADQIIPHALPVPQLKGIAASDTKFVAVGSAGHMWNSQDGQIWMINDDWPTGTVLHDVNWNGSQFVAVGQSGVILVGNGTGSGSQQATTVPFGSPTLNAIAWSSALQKYVAVGSSGNIWISFNAVADTWDFVPGFGGLPNVPFFGVTEGNGQFVAVGDGGTIVTSAAGQNWSPDISGTANTLTGIAWGNGRFVAVGNGGTVLVGLPSLTITTEALQNGLPVSAVAVGDAFQYKLTVKNNSSTQISNLSLTDTLPANVSYTAPNTAWSCSPPPNSPVTCTLAALAANSESVITLNVTAPPTVGNGSLVNNVLIQSPNLPADVLDSLTIGITITGGGGTNFPLTGGGGGAGSYFMLVLLCLACLVAWLRRNQMTQSCSERV